MFKKLKNLFHSEKKEDSAIEDKELNVVAQPKEPDKDVERMKQNMEIAENKKRLIEERKARRKEQEKDVSTLKHGAVWADKIADAVTDGIEDRVITPELAREIIDEMDTGFYEKNRAKCQREKLIKLLYHGGKKPCTVDDMNVIDGAPRVIFPRNGYEVEYSHQSLKITNKRDHENFSLSIFAINDQEANKLLSGIQNYSGKAPLTQKAIYKTLSDMEEKEEIHRHIEQRKANIKASRKVRAKLQAKDVTTLKAGAVWADKIANDKIQGEIPQNQVITPEVAKKIIKEKAIRGE